MKKWLLAGLVLMMMGSGFFVFMESDYFKIDIIQIEGDPKVTEYEVLEYAHLDRSTNLLMVDPGEAASALEEHPWIREASIDKHYPDEVLIRYEIRQPLLSVEYAGSYILVDQELCAVEVARDPGGLLTVYGMHIENFNLGQTLSIHEEDLMDATVDLVRLLELSDLMFIPSLKVVGNRLTLRISDDYAVDFGDGQNIETRFNAFYTIYRELEADGVGHGVIDVSTDGLPTYKPFGNED